MKLSDFDYPLPKELIAQRPLERRDASRLLVADRKTGVLTDRKFSDILKMIPAGDVLVLNDTKVFSARLLGRKKQTGGKVDVLFLDLDLVGNSHARSRQGTAYPCLIQPALKEGQVVEFSDGTEATYIGRDKNGSALLEFVAARHAVPLHDFLKKHGTMPLPPYIKREPEAADIESYQTVYAEKEGAVAAPTAGLHFTNELLEKLAARGVEILRITLHVGYGTFKPVEDLENHRMHAESFELSPGIAERINRARSEKRKIWAVGTTSLRVLETCVQKKAVIAGAGRTDLFIKPPFEFEAVDHLLTNFHLPKTTLLLLVSAFMGESFRKKAYQHAVDQKYRFYSYGDAMLIL